MRLFVLLWALMVLAASGTPTATLAQEVDDGAGGSETQQAPEAVPGPELDTLFEQLRRQPSRAPGNRIANQIREAWVDSGSDTINLLMDWSARAMRERKTSVAEDLLNQVVVLAPDYAEGWNRRATLYYQKREFGRSIADIERTLRLEPRHFGALAGLATILGRSGEDRKSLAIWYEVLALYPSNETAQDQVAELEEKLAGRGS